MPKVKRTKPVFRPQVPDYDAIIIPWERLFLMVLCLATAWGFFSLGVQCERRNKRDDVGAAQSQKNLRKEFPNSQEVIAKAAPAQSVPPAQGSGAARQSRGFAPTPSPTGQGAALSAPWPHSTQKQRLREMAAYYARRGGVDSTLVCAVIECESGWNVNAVGDQGRSLGLMQLGPAVRRAYRVSQPFDARQNLRAGISHLCCLLKGAGGNRHLALMRYNAGSKLASRGCGREYARKILRRLERK